MNTKRPLFAVYTLLSMAGATAALNAPRFAERPVGIGSDGSTFVTSHQTLTPAGTVLRLPGTRPKAVAASPDSKTAAVLCQNRIALFTAEGAPMATISGISAGPLGLCWSPNGNTLYAALSGGQIARVVRDGTDFRRADNLVVDTAGVPGEPDAAGRGRQQGDPQITGLAVSKDGARLFAAMGIRNAVAALDVATGKALRVVPVGVAPYHVALSPDGGTLAVACRGGAMAAESEPHALSAGTRVRIDPKTDAAQRGSIALVDTETYTVRMVEAGRQPGGMAFTPDSKTLYVASADDDQVLVLDTTAGKVVRKYSLQPPPDRGFGQIPTDVALSADGKTLYVACGGGNCVAALDAKSGRPRAHIPTGWFPIALSERQGTLIVASSKGLGSRNPSKRADKEVFGVHSTVGTVQFIPPSARKDSVALSRQVAQNNRWGMADLPPRRNVKPAPVPERVGEPSVFKHVVYIIKENQTYDSVFGDMPEGNGDPGLCTFPEEVTPNHHALAREFVLLDNTHTSGTNSADGHQWSVSAIANGYIEQNYAAHTRSYPYDGGDPLAYSPQGFLWTATVAAGKTVRVYGEFVNKPRIRHRETGKSGSWTELWTDYKQGMKNFEITADTDNAALKPHLHPYYIGFPSTVPDQWRADQFIADVDRFERIGRMPDLCILLLPNDHTMGTQPTVPTPRATVADNDLALGRIVERLTRSPFWKEMLILVIEDDSQYGLDHVDGHRTVALCISPYTRRRAVVSDYYDHTAFIRTIGLVLGFPAMNRFDRTATPLTACFASTPNFAPYTALPNRIPLDEMNPPVQALRGEAKRLAQESARLDWSDVDRADAEVVARAIWHAQYPDRPFPAHAYHPEQER